MSRPPRLHIVPPSPKIANATPEARAMAAPEEQLRALFAAEADLNRLMATVRAELSQARRRYRDKHGLLALPGLDTLRRLFS